MVEFALSFPLIVALCMGAGDFGRLFFHAVTVSNAASAGAHHGSLRNVNAVQTSIIVARATSDAGDLTGVSVTARQFCVCEQSDEADFSSEPTAIDCDLAVTPGSCASGGLPRVYVEATVDKTFQTLGAYPLIPDTTLVGRRATMRVQ